MCLSWTGLLALAPPAMAQGVPGAPHFVLGAGQPPLALAHQVEYWIDESGRATIDEVEARDASLPWRPRRLGQQDRLGDGALWIRFVAEVRGQDDWFIEAGSASIDRAQLFYRDRDGQWVVQSAGDRLPMGRWALPGRVPTFALAENTGRTVRYWLRIEHRRVDFAAPLNVLRAQDLLVEREREQFLLGAYFGLALLIATASLANGIAYRDRAFLSYAVYVAILGSGQLARMGIGAQHAWPEGQWNEASSYVLPGVTGAAALWFVKVVTDPAHFSRLLNGLVWALIAVILATVAHDAVEASRASLRLVLLATVLGLAALVALIGWSWIDGRDPDIRLIALGFLPVLLFALFPLARGLNLIPNSTLTRYGIFIGAVLEMPILYYALRIRSNRRRESEVRAAALSRTDALTGLAHRRGLLQRLEASLARARAQKQAFALLVVRIANIEAIVQEFGRDAAERATVVAASHLRRAITDMDCAARVGDHEFALLLESPVTQQLAMSRAQQVVASGLRQAEALPAALTLKFHVAVAMLPTQNTLDAEAALAWTLDGVQQMPPDTRKLIRPLNF